MVSTSETSSDRGKSFSAPSREIRLQSEKLLESVSTAVSRAATVESLTSEEVEDQKRVFSNCELRLGFYLSRKFKNRKNEI